MDSGKKEHPIDYARQAYQFPRTNKADAAIAPMKAEFAAIGVFCHGVCPRIENF